MLKKFKYMYAKTRFKIYTKFAEFGEISGRYFRKKSRVVLNAYRTEGSMGKVEKGEKYKLFENIAKKVKNEITIEKLKGFRTRNGNTQATERNTIEFVKSILEGMDLTYEEAGSQQSKDFRNVGGKGLDIEIKKTDSNIVYFNDTCPSKDIYYIIFATGGRKRYPAQVLTLNGAEFTRKAPWLAEYKRNIECLKDEYARGNNKKKLDGCISVYPRPGYKADIKQFLSRNKNN